VDDREDNCDFLFNPLQNDTDRDGQGDECDPCPNVADDGKDTDNDGLGDVCDFDADGDGVANVTDNCPLQFNPAQKDSDQDGVGDLCDNCLTKFNTGQLDRDEDRVGDVCDSDVDGDGDGVDDQRDNCASVPNPDQLDTDEDGLGDVCDVDDDGDNLGDSIDNCRLVENPDQEDQDEDGVGDACEDDADGDGTTDPQDVCPYNKHISRTNFTKFDQIALDPIETTQMDPFWTINDDGEEILQTLNSDPGMAIGHDVFNHFEYEGTLYISSDIEADRLDDDFAGFVFGYQNNRKFYVCVWKRRYQVYFSAAEPKPTAFPGIQLKVINSATGPGPDLRDALWQSDGTVNQSRLLWFSDVRWQFDTSYRWHLVHNPANGYMRVTWTQVVFD
jgi:syndecan 4